MLEDTLEFLQPTPKYRELCLLVELEQEPRISQKELGRRVGLAPSMVNSYIKSFVKRGYLLRTGENHRRMSYVLTRRGQEWKVELLTQFMSEAMQLYQSGESGFSMRLFEYAKSGIRGGYHE